MLWQLKEWSGDSGTKWRDRVIPFFTHVWPKQRALRTPAISSRLANFLLASDDLIPALMPLILPRLVPIRGGSLDTILLNNDPQKDPVRRFPAAILDLLWAILSEDPDYWPSKVETIIDRLAAIPETSGDARLSEVRRRRYR